MPLPDGLTARDAMAVGTAGFTAAMSVAALEARGLRPGDGPVLVTGASGGVGELRGRDPRRRAATRSGRRPARPTRRPGCARSARPASCRATRSPRRARGRSSRGAGRGRSTRSAAPTLPYVLRTLRTGAAVASSGNAGGPRLETTVLPFILRGVALLGMDSVLMPIEERRALWGRIATDLRPNGLGDGDHRGHARHARAGARRDPRRRGPRPLGASGSATSRARRGAGPSPGSSGSIAASAG